MKVFYDSHTDTLSVILKDNVAVHESDEDKPASFLITTKKAILYPLRFLTHPSESRTPATTRTPTGISRFQTFQSFHRYSLL